MAVVDHKPLLLLYNTPRRPKQMRVDRHRMKLMAFEFKVIHMSSDKMLPAAVTREIFFYFLF